MSVTYCPTGERMSDYGGGTAPATTKQTENESERLHKEYILAHRRHRRVLYPTFWGEVCASQP